MLAYKYLMFIVIIFLIALYFFGVDRQSVQKEDEILEVRIGSISPISGENERYGKSMVKVLDYQIEKINRDAVRRGVKFVLFHKDGMCSQDGGEKAYESLKKQKVRFIIGGFCSAETLGLVSQLSKDRIVVVSPASSDTEIEGLSYYLFSLSYNDEKAVKEMANLVLGYKSVGIISDDLKIINQFTEEAKAIDEEIEVRHEVVSEKTNVDDLFFEMEQLDVESLVLAVEDNEITKKILIAMNEMDFWDRVKLIGNNYYLDEEIIKVAPELLDGMTVVGAPNISSNKFGLTVEDVKKDKGSIDFVNEYYIASSIDALMLLTDSIVENINIEETEEYEEELEKESTQILESDVVAVLDVIETIIDRRHRGYILGDLDFRDTNFSDGRGVGIYKIEDGKAVFYNNIDNI